MICNQKLPMVMTPTIRRWCKEAELQGELEGQLRSKQDTAMSMLQDSMPTELIAKVTGLSVEEVGKMISYQGILIALTPDMRRLCLEAEFKGERKGERLGKLETARNMLRESMAPELIAKFTGLPVEKILALQGKE